MVLLSWLTSLSSSSKKLEKLVLLVVLCLSFLFVRGSFNTNKKESREVTCLNKNDFESRNWREIFFSLDRVCSTESRSHENTDDHGTNKRFFDNLEKLYYTVNKKLKKTEKKTGGKANNYISNNANDIIIRFFSNRILPNSFYEKPFRGFVDVNIQNGKIISVSKESNVEKVKEEVKRTLNFYFINLGELLITTAFIDVHAHISELGRIWEGYETATEAAAAGGISTLIQMPLNSDPPTTTLMALQKEYDAIKKLGISVDVGFWGGIVPENYNNRTVLLSLLQGIDYHNHNNNKRGRIRVLGFKAFLSPLPSTSGYSSVSPNQLKIAAKIIKDSGFNVPILVHSELMSEEEINHELKKAKRIARFSPYNIENDDYIIEYRHFVLSRPRLWEERAVRVVIDIAKQMKQRMHIVHLSDAENSLKMIGDYYRENDDDNDYNYDSNDTNDHKIRIKKRYNRQPKSSFLTVETCPHYLAFSEETIPTDDSRYKCVPPIRNQENQNKLWEALITGDIQIVASDHSPCTPELRHQNFFRAWAGISGLQFSVLGTWTEMIRRNLKVQRLLSNWAEEPARLSGLFHIKGTLQRGKQADLVIWNPEGQTKTTKTFHRWDGSAWSNRDLKGSILATIVNGQLVYYSGDIVRKVKKVGKVVD